MHRSTSSWMLPCFILEQNQVSKPFCVTEYWSFVCFCPHYWGSHVLIDALPHLASYKTLLLWNLFYIPLSKIVSWSKPPTPFLPLQCLLLLPQKSNTHALVSLDVFQNLTLKGSLGVPWVQEQLRRKLLPQKTSVQFLRLITKYDVLKILLVRLGTKVLKG